MLAPGKIVTSTAAMILLGWLVFSGCQTSSLTATQSVQIGDELNNQNRYNEAIKHYEDYLTNSPSLGVYRNYEMESDVYRKLAHIYSTQGDYDQSLAYLEKALKTDEEINKNQLNVVEDLRLLGVTHSYLGQYAEARAKLDLSLAKTHGMENSAKDQRRLAVADTYISLASVDLSLGNYVEALNFADQALEIYDRINDNLGQIESHLIKGHVSISRNKLGEAEDEIDRSKSIAQNNRLRTARQDQAMGDIYRLKGELENSLESNLDAYTQAVESNIRPQIIWATIKVGDAYGELGDRDKANELYREALNLQLQQTSDTANVLPSIQVRMGDVEQARNYWSQTGSSVGLGIVNLKLGDQFLEEGDLDSSSFYFRAANELFIKSGNYEGMARAKIGLSQTLIEQNSEAAINLLNEVLSSNDQPDVVWQSWYQKGRAFESQRNMDSAFYAYSESIRTIENLRGQLTIEEFRSSYFADKTIVYDRLINLILKNGKRINYLNDKPVGKFAFELNERSRSRTFLDLLGNREISSKSSKDDIVLVEEQQLRLKIQQLGKQVQKNELNGKAHLELKSELEESQVQYQELLQKIKLSNPIYLSLISIEPPALNEIQTSIDQGSALLEYWVGSSSTTVWMITREEIQYKTLDIGRQEWERQVKAVRNSLRFRLDEELDVQLKALHTLLIDPLSEWTEAYENIGIIPHGPLHFLPFQALIDREGRYLIENKNLFYSPSASVYHYTRQKTPDRGDDVLGIALGDHSIGEHNPLPGTEYEVNQIAQFYDQYTPMYREKSSESFFKENAGNYGQIHIATHGILSDEQPLYSYLLMSSTEEDDGRLTVDEIMDMDLGSNLVTLSACETALGDLNQGDELVGLSRAFLYAGTPAVVVSLWTVDDLSTSLLMTKFHQFLREDNAPFIALSKAQRELLKEEFQLSDSRGRQLEWEQQIKDVLGKENQYHKSPYYWAPFVLIGHGD